MIELNFERDVKYFVDAEKAKQLALSLDNCSYDKEQVIFHYYWRSIRPFGRKQAAAVKSAIVTQDILNKRSVIWLWSDIDLNDNEYVKPLKDYITLKRYDPAREAVGTALEGSEYLNAVDSDCFVDGDLFRILILYAYGGVYCDCDTILLRNFAPLLDNEFVYQWGTETDKMNGAVMRCKKHGRFAYEMLKEIRHSKNTPGGTTGWGSDLYGRVRQRYKEFTVFPCFFFNSEWQIGHNMGESHHPFRTPAPENTPVDLFEGAFAWHWHNKWDHEIEPGCKFEILEKIIEKKFIDMKNYRVDVTRPHCGGNIAGGDPSTYTPELWRWLRETYNIQSVLDVGCGEGRAVRWWQDNHIIAHGIDGLKTNIDRCPPACWICDITNNQEVNKAKTNIARQYDLVWCCEVAEHIEEKYMENLMYFLSRGRVIAITTAKPGQDGYHHVNCKSDDYWIATFKNYKYEFDNTGTMLAKQKTEGWFKSTGKIFVRKTE